MSDETPKKKSKCGGQFQPCCVCGDVNLSAMPCSCQERERNEQDYYDSFDPAFNDVNGGEIFVE